VASAVVDCTTGNDVQLDSARYDSAACVARGACVAAALISLASRLASLLQKSQYLMSGAFLPERLTPLFVASHGDEYILRNIHTDHGSYATHKDSFPHIGLTPLVTRLDGLCRCGSGG
jgi:hypothetical protein